MEPRIERATRFYADCLELPQMETPPSVTFFGLGTTWLALWSRESLAADAGLSAQGSGFRGFALAHNVRLPAEVDALLARVAQCDGTVTRAGHPTDRGGYSGYFTDPDGFAWKVAHTPPFHMSERCAARCLRFAARTQSIRCDVIEVERVRGMRYRVQQDPARTLQLAQ